MKNTIYLFSLAIILGNFILTNSCSEGKNMTSSAQKNIIVATLRGKVKPQQVESAFQRYQMTLLQSIDRDTNTWSFSFDENSINPDEFLKSLQDSQFIKSAKFGTKVSKKNKN